MTIGSDQELAAVARDTAYEVQPYSLVLMESAEAIILRALHRVTDGLRTRVEAAEVRAADAREQLQAAKLAMAYMEKCIHDADARAQALEQQLREAEGLLRTRVELCKAHDNWIASGMRAQQRVAVLESTLRNLVADYDRGCYAIRSSSDPRLWASWDVARRVLADADCPPTTEPTR